MLFNNDLRVVLGDIKNYQIRYNYCVRLLFTTYFMQLKLMRELLLTTVTTQLQRIYAVEVNEGITINNRGNTATEN